MSDAQPLVRIPIGIVIERRKAKSAWAEFVWRPVAVLPAVPEAVPWTALNGSADRVNFYGGAAEIELHHSDAAGYCQNLATATALLWVALRPTGREPPYEIAAVTAEPSEGEAFTANATDIVETVPMPEPVRAVIAGFVAEHHAEHPFAKRERDRADPEVMARHVLARDRK
ncbi:MAG: DUF3305 domain-containing protein [Xanthobacteraceae bacterium]